MTIIVSVPGTVPDVTEHDARRREGSAARSAAIRSATSRTRKTARRDGNVVRTEPEANASAAAGRGRSTSPITARPAVSVRRILGVDPGLRTTGYGVDRVRDGRAAPGRGRRAAAESEAVARAAARRSSTPRCSRSCARRGPTAWWSKSSGRRTSTRRPAVLMGHARGVLALAAGAQRRRGADLAHARSSARSPAAAPRARSRSRRWSCSCSACRAARTRRRHRRAGARARLRNVEAQRDRFAELGVVMPQRRSRAGPPRVMFSRIAGTLLDATGDAVRVDVGGLAYDVVLPPSIAEKVAEQPAPVDARDLRAASRSTATPAASRSSASPTPIEREFFEALISVASIGPKSAARAFSAPMAPHRARDRCRRSRVPQDAARHRPAEGARHRREAARQSRDASC